MRYRKLDANGDYVLGAGVSEILVNTPDAVAQAIMTRLLLSTGEWFLDAAEGTPYKEDILGTGKQTLYDAAIQDRILGTPGVLTIDAYASFLDTNRNLTVQCTVTTQYSGQAITFTASPTQGNFVLNTSALDSGATLGA